MNGKPVEASDPSGAFFTRVTVAPGHNTFTFTATDPLGQTATATLTLEGVAAPATGQADFSNLSDISASFQPAYARTSFEDATQTLFADVAVRNTGQFPTDTPLYVGVTNISDPSVRVLHPAGLTPDGVPYFDFTTLVPGGTLAPTDATGSFAASFFVPNRRQFTYDLVFFGQLNRAPAFTSIPDVEALAGRSYVYAAAATDPDGDPLTFSLPSAPPGMAVDPTTGRITWTPGSADAGTAAVTLHVQDGRGGSAEQRYVLIVKMPPPNRPPVFTSVPVVSGQVNTPYTYQATASDPDSDPLTFSVVSGPSGLTVGPTSGLVTWQPASAQVGTASVTLKADDGHGGTATQAYVIQATMAEGNHPPVIVSQPIVAAQAGQPYKYSVTAVDPDQDPIAYSLTTSPPGMTIDSKTGTISWTPDGLAANSTLPFRLGSTGRDYGRTGHVDSEGNLYIVGQFAGTTDFDPSAAVYNLTSRGDQDAFAAKYDSSGRFLWARRVGGTGEDCALDVTTDGMGNVYISGRFTGSDDFDPGPGVHILTSAGAHDVFLWKLDRSGSFVWAQQLGSSDEENAGEGVLLDSNGDVYMPGAFQGIVDFDPGPGVYTLTTTGTNGGFVWKLDSNGNFIWARRVADAARGLSLDASGNVYVVSDPNVIQKLTSAGDPIWTRSIGGYANNVAVDKQGNVFAGGQFSGTADFDPGPATFALTSAGGQDGFIVKLTTDGTFLWARRFGGSTSNEGLDTLLDAAGNVYCGKPEFQGTASFGASTNLLTVTSRGGIDTLLIKLGSDGSLLWTYQFGGPGNDGAMPFSVDASGTVYLTGFFEQTVDFDPGPGMYNFTSAGDWDTFLSTVSSTGNMQTRLPVAVRADDGRGGSDTQSFTINVAAPSLADLTVPTVNQSALTFDGQLLTVSGTISATIANSGSQAVVSPFDVLFFEDRNNNSTYDPGVDNVLGKTSVSGLGAGATMAVTAALSGSVLFSDNRIWALVDSGSAVAEINETNNLGVRSCRILSPSGQSVPAPDLTASYVRSQAVSQGFTYTARIGSGGSASAPAGINVGFYQGDPRAGGVLLGLDKTKTQLLPGQYEDISVTLSGPFLADIWVLADDGLSRSGGYDFTTFDVPGASSTAVYGINSSGQLVGSASFPGATTAAFFWDKAAFTFFRFPGSVSFTEAMSLNDIGQVVGNWDSGHGFMTTTTFASTIPIIISGMDLPGSSTAYDVNNLGEVVGYYSVQNIRHGYLRSRDGVYATVSYPGAIHTWATGINEVGQIVGFWGNANTGGTYSGYHGWIRQASGQFLSFDIPLASGTVAHDVNNAGQVVGWYGDSSGRIHGYLRDSVGVITTIDVPGSTSTYIRNINNSSLIAGHYQDPAGKGHGFLGTPVGTVRECNEQNNFYHAVLDGTSVPPQNHPPSITTVAPTTAIAGQLYRYDAQANDPDGDLLTFDLALKPDGMAVQPTTGTVVWTPAPDQVGTQVVTLRVQDGRGGVALQSFTITVSPANTPPVITSTPQGPAIAGTPYRYPVTAQDAEGDAITFRLDASPSGMTINSTSGLVSWTPGTSQVGTQHVAVTASDSHGASTTQSFDLPVVATAPNSPPSITSTPRGSVRIGDTYLYQVVAVDPNGDPLTYSLPVAPAGMTISASGLVSWVPAAAQAGPNSVQVRVDDGRGGYATQTYTLTVVTQVTNSPPNITSTPPQAATVGRAYAYNLAATDPDNDPLAWSLDAAPAGASLDPARGTLRWTPTADQLGTQAFVIRVSDPLGGYAAQSYSVAVRPVNVPPAVTSVPPTTATVATPYSYPVAAADPDGDPLTFTLTAAPAGMTVSAAGLVSWTPTAAQVGSQNVALRVDDGQGGTATQTYTVVVSATPVNQPPVITSSPPLAAVAAQPYTYAASAADPEGQLVSFQLLDAPAGMTVSAAGLVSWTPTSAQVGSQSVVLAARDPQNATATQAFVITVTAANHPPTISSAPVQVVTAGLPYRYDVRATDPDGDPLTFTLTQGPAGMALDTLGRLTWAPGIPDVGTRRIKLTVADNHGAALTQEFDLAVAADTQAPRISLSVTPNPVDLGRSVQILFTATDNVAVASRVVTVGGTPLALDAAGRATILANAAGSFAVVATARDAAGNPSVATTTLTVIDRSDTEPPSVAITTPADGAVLTGPVNVVGTASDANLVSYVLEALPADGGPAVTMFTGTTSVTNGVLGRFDPTGLANDSYTLRLTATDAGGNQSLVERTVEVAGDLKIGNFTLSFTDLSIPVSGIPVTVTRTYDTLQAGRAHDLGYGWRLEFRDADLRTSVAPTGDEEYGVFNPFYEGARVYVTLPGGRREGFTFKPQRLSGFAGYLAFYKAAFIPDPGVTSALSVPDNDTLIYVSGDYYTLSDLPYNPTDTLNFGGVYTVTTKDGLAYTLDAVTGDVRTVADANGNALTFTDSSIDSNRGVRVTFDRDPQGRIIAARDPAGHVVRYRYDARGDLVGVTDRDGQETRFVYAEPRRAHFLTQVIDPLGRTGVRTEYDDQGRLVTLVDAAGQQVQVAHDPDHALETVRDALGNPTTFEYDARGNVVREVNALGGTTLRTYDGANHLLTETDPLGHTTSYTYDGDGNVLTTTDPLGNVTRSTYLQIRPGLFDSIRGARPVSLLATTTDSQGHTTTNTYAGTSLVSSTDAAGNVTRYTYDGSGNQTSITDAAGKTTSFTYDGRGNLLTQTDATGHTTAYTYDAASNQLTQTTTLTTPSAVRTLTTATTYDASGRPTSVTDAEGRTTRTEYDALGRQSATVDALGRRTTFTYDDRGQLTRTTFPDGASTATAYDAAGRRVSSTDRAGRVTGFEYDALGRLVTTVYPDATPLDPADNPRTRTEYDAAGRVTAQVDELGHRTEFTYDAAGRQTAVRDALGRSTATAYDTAGRRTSTTDPLGHTTRFVYDALGRTVQTVFADSTTTGQTYDALGRVTVQTDASGRNTAFEYDALGRLTAVVDAAAGRTVYAYDEAGNLVRQQDAEGRVTRYEYDGLGRRTATVLPLGQRSTTVYDAAGNVASTTDFNGATVLYAYDLNNRLTARTLPDGTSFVFTYTPTGQRSTVTDARGLTQYAYDARDRLVSRTDPDGTAISYTYDSAGNRTSVTTPAGTTTYTFDALNRQSTVTDPASGLTRYTYDAAGNLARTDFPNGTWETRQYDPLNRLLFLENRGPSGVLSSYRYTLSPTGNRTKVVEDTGRTVDYAYDALYRLVGESITDAAAGNRGIAYTYDKVGNRQTRTDSAEGTTSYAYDANDRLLTETLASQVAQYTYDAAGNTLSRVKSATDQVFYHWNADARLTSADVTDAAGTKHIAYQYDADGLRVSSTVAGDETRYLLDTAQPYAQVVLEYRPSGLAIVSYVYGNDLISQTRAAVPSYYLVDALGSTRALTNSSGIVTDRYTYDAFGRTIKQVGSTSNLYLFTGEQRDSNVGLDYLRARYMSAGIGRFYGRDPFGGFPRTPMSRHSLLYAYNDPVNKFDPTGKTTLAEASVMIAIQSALLVQRMLPFAEIALVFSHELPRLARGVQYFYGNWGGPGHGGERPYDPQPIDAIDEACMWHDLTYAEKGYFSTEADMRLISDIEMALKNAGQLNLTTEARVKGRAIQIWFAFQVVAFRPFNVVRDLMRSAGGDF